MDALPTELLEYVKQAVDFGKDQAPLVAQEMLRYGEVCAWLYLGIAVLLFVAAFFLIRYGRDRAFDPEDEAFMPTFTCVVGGAGVIAGTIVIFVNVFVLIQIHTAPRLYILEQIKELMR